MKKITTLLLFIIMSTMLITGCSSSADSSNLYISNCPDNINGMGKTYYVNNLEKGIYEVEFTAKEYEYGTLKKEHTLYQSTVEHNGKNNTLKVGVVDGNEKDSFYISAIINDMEAIDYELDFLKEAYNTGVALSILDENKSFDLDKEVAIAVYSIGGEKRTTNSVNIDEEFEIGDNNLKDLVVYIKLHKTK